MAEDLLNQKPDHIQAINNISKTMSQTMGNSMGEFRRTADTHNKNILRIVKDLGSSILTQKRQIAGLTETMEEVADSSNKIASKIDQMNNHLMESLNIQQEMLAQMKNVFSGIDSMNNNWNQFTNTTNNTSIFGGIFESLKSIAKSPLVVGGLAGLATVEGMKALGGDGKDTAFKTSGSLAQNQQEAYKAARAEGLSDTAAKIAVANVSGENLKNPGGVYADPSSRNPNQKAHGIVAWDDERSARIKQVFGKYPQEMSVADQTKAYIWEMKTYYKKAYADLTNENMEQQQRLASVVANFEVPKDTAGAVANRMGYLRGLKVSDNDVDKVGASKVTGDVTTAPDQGGGQTTPQQATPTTQPPPAITPAQAPAAPAQATPERHPQSHGGIISGTVDKQGGPGNDEKGKLGTVNPGILGKFKEIQSQAGTQLSVTSGFRDPAHNAAVGGAKNSAHTRGNAVDVTFGGGVPETLKLIDIASKAGIGGIGVYRPGVLHFDTEGKRAWGPDYHRSSVPNWAEGAIAKHLGTPGATTTPDSGGGGQTTPDATKAGGGESGGSGESGGGAAAEQQNPTEQDGAALMKMYMGGAAGGMGGMGGLTGLMGGMGGMGGLAGMAGGLMEKMAPMMHGLMPKMPDIPPAQPILPPERPIPVETPAVSAAANTIEQNALQTQIDDYNQKQQAADVSKKSDEIKERLDGIKQGQGESIPGVDYNGPHDQEVISKWAERLGFGGSYFKEFDKIKIF